METNKVALEVVNVSKRYGGIDALKAVNLSLYEGEVCALLGENGAGKSTLIKILTGVESRDEGEILLYGSAPHITDPVAARQHGIAAIYQELSLIEHLTVAQNIFLGHEPTKALGWNDTRRLVQDAAGYLQRFHIDIDPRARVCDLGMGQKRIVEIVKALTIDARILFLDEPTTGMSQAEIERLFQIMGELKAHHVTMIYISHYLDEVFKVCDRAAVLRDGQSVGIFDVQSVDKPTLIRAMIGKDLQTATAREARAVPQDDAVLEAVEFQAEGMQHPLSFSIAAGEIVGVTGIIGSGKSELGQGLFGAARQTGGTLRLNRQIVRFRSPEAARKHGVAFIPEDRKQQGLLLPHSVEGNLTLANLDRVSAKAFVVPRRRRRAATEIAERLRIVPPNVKMRARNLSGGNQQKVVIGKWLVGDPTLLIMDEPTRGVDVGAKTEIYSLIESLAASGKAVLVLSSEFDEVRRLCDRILVLRQGAIVGEMRSDEASGDRLLSLALGG